MKNKYLFFVIGIFTFGIFSMTNVMAGPNDGPNGGGSPAPVYYPAPNYDPPYSPPPPPPPTDAQIISSSMGPNQQNPLATAQQYGVPVTRVIAALAAAGQSPAQIAQACMRGDQPVPMVMMQAALVQSAKNSGKSPEEVAAIEKTVAHAYAVADVVKNFNTSTASGGSGGAFLEAAKQLAAKGMTPDQVAAMLSSGNVDAKTSTMVQASFAAATLTAGGTTEQKAAAEGILKDIAGGKSVEDALATAMFGKNISLEDLAGPGVSKEYKAQVEKVFQGVRNTAIQNYTTEALKNGMSLDQLAQVALTNGVSRQQFCEARGCDAATTTAFNQALQADTNLLLKQYGTDKAGMTKVAAILKNRGISEQEIAEAYGFTDATKVGAVNVTDIFNKVTADDMKTAKQFFNDYQKTFASNAAAIQETNRNQAYSKSNTDMVIIGDTKVLVSRNDKSFSFTTPDGVIHAGTYIEGKNDYTFTMSDGTQYTMSGLKQTLGADGKDFVWKTFLPDGKSIDIDLTGNQAHNLDYYNTYTGGLKELSKAESAGGTSLYALSQGLKPGDVVPITDPVLSKYFGTSVTWDGTSFLATGGSVGTWTMEATLATDKASRPFQLTPRPDGTWTAGCGNEGVGDFSIQSAPKLTPIALPGFGNKPVECELDEDTGGCVGPKPTKVPKTYCELHPSDSICTKSTPKTYCELHPSDSICTGGGGGGVIPRSTNNRAPTCTIQLSGIDSQGNEFPLPSSSAWYSTPAVLATAVCSDPDTEEDRKCAGDTFEVYDTKGTFSDTLQVIDMMGEKGTCSFTANIDDQAPILSLSAKSASYVQDLGSELVDITFPTSVGNTYDFLVEFDDTNDTTPVSGIAQTEVNITYADGSTETTTLKQVDNGVVEEIPTGEVSHTDGYVRLKKSGETFVAVTVTDAAGNATTKNFTLNIDTTPQVRLDKAGWKDYRTDTVALRPQEISSSIISPEYHRFDAQWAYPSMPACPVGMMCAQVMPQPVFMGAKNAITGVSITPSYIYTLINNVGTQIWQKTVVGDGNMTFGNGTNGTVDLSKLPDGQYTLLTQYTDNILGSSLTAEVPVFIDNTNAPELDLGLTTPDAAKIAGTNPMGTQYCDATGVANEKRVDGKRFINCIPAIDFSNFDTGSGKRDTYAIIFKKLFGSSDTEPVESTEQDMPIIVSGPVDGSNVKLGVLDITADHVVDPVDIANNKTAGESTDTVREKITNETTEEERTELFVEEVEKPLAERDQLSYIDKAELPMEKEKQEAMKGVSSSVSVVKKTQVAKYDKQAGLGAGVVREEVKNSTLSQEALRTLEKWKTTSKIPRYVLTDDDRRVLCQQEAHGGYDNTVCTRKIEGGVQYSTLSLSQMNGDDWSYNKWKLMSCNAGYAPSGETCVRGNVTSSGSDSSDQGLPPRYDVDEEKDPS